MSRSISRRLLAQSPFPASTNPSQHFRLPLRCLRPFSKTSTRRAEDDTNYPGQETVPFPQRPRATPQATRRPLISPSLNPKAAPSASTMADLASFLQDNERARNSRQAPTFNQNASSMGDYLGPMEAEMPEQHHLLSVYATRHNTHINFSRPQTEREKTESNNDALKVMISISAGNLGFRKSARKHYDSAFQTAAYVMARMQERGMTQQINKLDVHLRGFGAGREAVTKALLGSEGRFIRGKIVKVADNTRLKFGGTRSKKPRRLG